MGVHQQAIPAVLLQHELGQILQDLLAVQSHKLLPTDLIQGAMVSRRLTGIFPSFPSALLSPDRSEARGREGSGQRGKGGLPDMGEGNQPGEVGSRGQPPFIDLLYNSPRSTAGEQAQDRTEAQTLPGTVFNDDLQAQTLPHTLLEGRVEMGLWHQEISCSHQQAPQVHLAWVNKSAYGAKPRGSKGWQVPRGQISKILAHKGPGRTLLPGS